MAGRGRIRQIFQFAVKGAVFDDRNSFGEWFAVGFEFRSEEGIGKG
jgi:hypothetical protein